MEQNGKAPAAFVVRLNMTYRKGITIPKKTIEKIYLAAQLSLCYGKFNGDVDSWSNTITYNTHDDCKLSHKLEARGFLGPGSEISTVQTHSYPENMNGNPDITLQNRVSPSRTQISSSCWIRRG
jgi:hypothetical protein